MKKILEVLQYGEMDIRFNTDIKVEGNPEIVPAIVSSVAFSMATRLWGGKELSVLAIIRALAIADLSLCADRDRMLRELNQSSSVLARAFQQAKKEIEKHGGKVLTFGPEVMPPKMKS